MSTTVAKWKMFAGFRSRGKQRDEQPAADAGVSGVPADIGLSRAANSVLLLIPAEGVLSFYVHVVADIESAQAVFASQPPGFRDRIIAFRATHEQPEPSYGTERQPEVVVLTRDGTRPGVIHLSSFVEMEAAQSFVRFEATRGLNLGLVNLYWAVPVEIETDAGNDPAPAVEPMRYAATQVIRAVEPAREPAPEVARSVEPEIHSTTQVVRRVHIDGGPAAAPPTPFVSGTPMVKRTVQPAPKPASRPAGPTLISRLRAWPGWRDIAPRMFMGALLKEDLYEEIKKDANAEGQAWVIVGATALAAAIGAFNLGPQGMLVHMFASPLGWIALSLTTYWVGTKAFKGRLSDEGLAGLFVGMAFGGAPRILFIMALFPTYGPLLALLALVWVGVSTAVATRRLLELPEAEAAVVAMVSCLTLFAVSLVVPAILS